MAAITVLSASVRSGVLAFGIGLAALAIPQLLDTATAETTDSAPAAASTTDTARPASAARPAGPKARAVRTARAGGPAASTPAAPAPTAARTTADAPAAAPASATPATAWTPLSARPRYRSPDFPATAASRPSEELLRGVDGTYVYLYNRTDQTLAVVQVPGGGRNDPEADPRFLAPGEKSDFYGDNNGQHNMDVRLRIYTAVSDGAGGWRKDEMREIITATNQWLGYPYVRVHMDPKLWPRPLLPPLTFSRAIIRPSPKTFDSGFAVGENWFADYDLKGPLQTGQTGTFVLRLADKEDPDYKVFQIEVFKIPAGSTQDYDVEAPEAAGRI